MKNHKLIKIISFVLISVVFIAAAPMVKSELVSLTIENQSDDYVTFRLQGPQFYFLMVKPDTSATFTVKRGLCAKILLLSNLCEYLSRPDQEKHNCGSTLWRESLQGG